MSTPDNPQRMRLNWSKGIAVIVGCVVVAGLVPALFVCLVIFRASKCENIDESSVRSPDGRWVAQSTTMACPVGLLSVTNYDDIVTLSATTAASGKANAVRIFECDGCSAPLTITWPNSNVLVLIVADEGAVRVSKHEFANVTIKYEVPKWLWDNLGEIETVHLLRNRESQELYKAGKMSSDDLRISREVDQADAQEWANFRQWVVENASHEGDSASDTLGHK
jgi:hypothetical protein